MSPTIFEELEAKVLTLRALQAELRDWDAGESFGEVIARPRAAASRSERGV